MIELRTTLEEATRQIAVIPHEICQRAKERNWRANLDRTVPAQSVCWLFCWAKTGINSAKAAQEARRVFDAILRITYDQFDEHVPHQWARWARKAQGNIEGELDAYLNETMAESALVTLERSQGFVSNSVVRRKVEAYAMQRATGHFQVRGYQVFDEHTTKPYDLRCVMGEGTLFVEVKGTQTTGERVLLTHGEVEFSRSHAMALFLLSSVTVLQDDALTVSGGVEAVYEPWQVNPERLRPVVYHYTLAENADDDA